MATTINIDMEKSEFLTSQNLIESPTLFYTAGHKYQARCQMIYFTGICGYKIVTDLITLRKDGWMLVESYFAWDGASGPAIDTNNNMRGSHAHDALAALMRMGLLPMSCIEPSNMVIRRLMIDDGARPWRATGYKVVLDRTSFWANPKCARPFNVAP